MSDPSLKPWSDNPYAPQIPYELYFAEKTNFAGVLIGAIFYGTPTHSTFTHPCSRCLLDRPRDRHRPVLPVHNHVAQPRRSRKGGHKVGTRSPRGGHVLARDGIHRVHPRHPIHLLHRQPRVPWCHWRIASRARWIPVLHLLKANRYRSECHVPLEQLVGRWSLGKLCVFKFGHLGVSPGAFTQLYRCYVIYGMNYWVIAFPFLMYLASWGAYLDSPAKASNDVLR